MCCVRALEGPSVAESVARGAELFDDSRGMAPREAAVQAKADNRPLVRTAPAIVAGERRMFRVLDVPLGGAGVAGFAFDIEDLEQTRARSEEQPSELQSLMRNSYAVF